MSSRSGHPYNQKIELTEAERELLMGDGFGQGKLPNANATGGDRNGEESIQAPNAAQIIGKRPRRYFTNFLRDLNLEEKMIMAMSLVLA